MIDPNFCVNQQLALEQRIAELEAQLAEQQQKAIGVIEVVTEDGKVTVPAYAAPVVQQPALERYNKIMEGCSEKDPIERLRFFCSLAMSGQDWLDVERFFDDLTEPVVPDGMVRPDQEALQQIIAAALYDFGGFITTRQKQLVASATDNATDTAEALKEFMEMRGINPCQDVPVLSWQCWIAAAQEESPHRKCDHLNLISDGTTYMCVDCKQHVDKPQEEALKRGLWYLGRGTSR